MPYQYTATNAEGKPLTGVINAMNDEDAKKQLGALGLSILELTFIEASQTQAPQHQDLQKFEFEATDKNAKQVKGTIPAKEALLAYKRLIEEYQFTVSYLAPQDATPEQKIQIHQTGLHQLHNEYELKKNQKKGPATEKPLSEDPKFITEKNILLEQIDSILQKTNALLTRFEAKLSPEKKAEINGYVDKLLRIKSSNNLDYIRNTCKELLNKVQEDEIFLTSSEHDHEREAIMMESQKMMLELSKSANAKVSAGTQIKQMVGQLEQKLSGSNLDFLLNPIQSIKSWFQDPPEVERLKIQLKALKTQRLDAFKILAKTYKHKETRTTTKANVHKIHEQIKQVKLQLKDARSTQNQNRRLIKQEKHIYFLEESNTFLGWLLIFYLTYYFLGHYVTTRGLPLNPFFHIPFDLSQSAIYKYLLTFAFIGHGALSLKLNFFLRSKIANIALTFGTLLLCLLVLFNV